MSGTLRLVAAVICLGAAGACSTTESSAGTEGTGGVPSAPIVAVSTSTSSSTSTTSTLAPTTTPAPTTTVDPTSVLRACVESWPLQERVALLVWPSVYSADWSSAVRVADELGVGGVILMKPSDSFAANLATNLGALDATSRHGVLVATDEEGGAVQRLAALGPMPSQEAMSALTPEARRDLIIPHAQQLSAAGVDVILGPVVDVRPVEGSDPLGQGRLFLGDGEAVAALAAEYTEAWQSAGLLPVLKHFPGHGSASTDTHLGLAVTPPLEVLAQQDLVPYRQLQGTGAAVMVGHLDVPGLTDGVPASLSPAAYAYLRNELGYGDALVMTDGLGMGGVGLSISAASVQAIIAGADVAIFTDTGAADDVIQALLAAVADGRLPVERVNDAASRVARELAARGTACQPGG